MEVVLCVVVIMWGVLPVFRARLNFTCLIVKHCAENKRLEQRCPPTHLVNIYNHALQINFIPQVSS